METKEKDGWDKANILLRPLGGLLTALAVAGLGFYGSQVLEKVKTDEMHSMQIMQSKEASVRLYSELMSKREEAESALRKDMFTSIIESFLSPESATIETKVLNLELLVYNFHESLNLKPLFMHLKREIGGDKEYLKRLEKVAKEIKSKQLGVLEGAGEKFSETINLKNLKFLAFGEEIEEVDFVQRELSLGGIKRLFTVRVLYADMEKKEVEVSLEVKTLQVSNGEEQEPKEEENVRVEFRVGFFDLPMIDNTRLSNDQRSALVLNDWGETTADITLIYYPGAYASLKEKPYYQEVIQNLLKTRESLDAANFFGESVEQ